jgi:glycosyltransferase involved in cell wall biosynthesis/2-polyprenyl-3-methyl-5-hydroxy-6-metoxy-1,4-benzoquinol methylase
VELAREFPRCRVSGLDFSREAVAIARRNHPAYEFLESSDGQIPRAFDVIVTSNCLEHFDDPLSVARIQLGSCRGLYLLLVPHREDPLSIHHHARFDENTFPLNLGEFLRIQSSVIHVDRRLWAGQQLLVVYASPSFLAGRRSGDDGFSEKMKWDHYYHSLSEVDESEAVRSFDDDLARRIDELLPAGGQVLEAGCGAGQQSLALSRIGKHELTLMDFSTQALEHAKRLFERACGRASFKVGDVIEPGEPEFDLVFNAGVLEHYEFDEQVNFIRGMASRSRRYVLVLVPNRLCYWYWIWRVRACSAGLWPFGKEAPMADLSRAFEAAGLRFLGQYFGGETWSENFINALPGLDPSVRELILKVHRGEVLPLWQRGYLLAALGCIGEPPEQLPDCWSTTWPHESPSEPARTSMLADTLALVVAGEHRLASFQADARAQHSQLQGWLADSRAQLDQATGQLAEARDAVASLQTLSAAQADELRETRQKEERANRYSAELQGRCDLGERTIASLSERIRVLEADIALVTSGRAWVLANLLRKLRQRVAPPGSLTARLGRLGSRAARKANQGPIPFAKAVARHSVRRIPHAWRQQINGLATYAAARRARHPLPPDRASAWNVSGLVSVVLPVYNQAYLLGSSIESVLAQKYTNFELIIVNDGSTDDVEQVLRRYAGDPRVRVLSQVNQKLPSALSNGFEFARGEFWTWTSADNLMEPDQLRRQVEFLRAHPETAMVYADYVAIDDRGDPLRDTSFRPPNRRTPDSPEIHLPRTTSTLNTVQDNFIGPCFMYRGWVGKFLGEYDPGFLGAEDYDHWMRLNTFFRIDHLGTDELLYRYRVHDDSMSGRTAELKIAERAARLMEHERQRAAAFAQPWTVVVDPALRSVLREGESDGNCRIRWAEGTTAAACHAARDPADADRTLLLVDASNVSSFLSHSPDQTGNLAVWFPSVESAYENWVEVHRHRGVGFTADDATACRLALLGIESYVIPPGESLLGLPVKRAKHGSFRERHRPANPLPRSLPSVFHDRQRRLHVLIQVDNFKYGGLENVVLALATGLGSQQFQVTILVLGVAGAAAQMAREQGIRVLDLPAEDREAHYRRLLLDEGVGLVNAHYSIFGAEIAGGLGVPFVQVVHNTYLWFTPRDIAAYQAADRHTTAYVCVSSLAARFCDRRLGLPPAKMIVVPNGVDTRALEQARLTAPAQLRNELGLGPDDFVFLNVGQICPPKSQVEIVRALAEVVRTDARAKVLMVGRCHDPGYEDRLESEITRHGLERSVVRPGHREDAARFYWLADAFLLPSYWEGWSLALGEAAYAGLPIIATDVGGARELLAWTGGRLIAPPARPLDLNSSTFVQFLSQDHSGFVAELAAAMRSLCGDPGRPIVTPALRQFLDLERVQKAYANVFLWLAQGGSPDAARAWTAGRDLADANGELAGHYRAA